MARGAHEGCRDIQEKESMGWGRVSLQSGGYPLAELEGVEEGEIWLSSR